MSAFRFKVGGAIFGYGLTGDLVPSDQYYPKAYRVMMPAIKNGQTVEMQTLSDYVQVVLDFPQFSPRQ